MTDLLIDDSPVGLCAKLASLELIVRDSLSELRDLTSHLRDHIFHPFWLFDNAPFEFGICVKCNLSLVRKRFLYEARINAVTVTDYNNLPVFRAIRGALPSFV